MTNQIKQNALTWEEFELECHFIHSSVHRNEHVRLKRTKQRLVLIGSATQDMTLNNRKGMCCSMWWNPFKTAGECVCLSNCTCLKAKALYQCHSTSSLVYKSMQYQGLYVTKTDIPSLVRCDVF